MFFIIKLSFLYYDLAPFVSNGLFIWGISEMMKNRGRKMEGKWGEIEILIRFGT
jgi:hypothetical protein